MPLLRMHVSSWMAAVDAAGGPDQEDALDIPIPDIDPNLVTETERALTISYLLGMYHASPQATMSFADDERTVKAIPFNEAVKYMKTRVPLTKKEWTALEPQLRFRAFTVAALATPDAIDKAKGMITTALEEGKSKAEFWKETRVFEEAGLTHAAPLYWDNVYRTNIQTDYNTGRAAEYMRENPEYIEFIGIDDGRQSAVCYALSHPAVQLPASHPFWASHWPPLHFRCRSTTRGMYPEEVAALREADPAWSPSDAETIQLPETAVGFGGNPLDSGSFWKMTPSMKARAEEYGLLDKIEAYAKSLGLPLDGIAMPAASAAATPASGGVPVFKTVKAAEKWVKAHDLADECSFTGCDIDLVHDLVDRWNTTLEEYPEAREKMQFFGTSQKRNDIIKNIVYEEYLKKYNARGITGEMAEKWSKKHAAEYVKKYFTPSPRNIASYMSGPGVNGISINKKFANDLEALTKGIEYQIKIGWFPQMEPKATAVFDHEVGHLLDDIYGLSKSEELSLYKDSLLKTDIIEGLSEYGTTNVAEFVAESWAEVSNSKAPRAIAKTVADMMAKRRKAR